jgi:VWFA-related protein
MIGLLRKLFCVGVSMIVFGGGHLLIAGGLLTQDPKDEQVKLSASLVQVPATVTDRSGKFVSDLSKNDFSLAEDGKKQDISFFAAVKQPFSAVLVLDTSNSTQDRLRVIQNAAVDFTKQLRTGDRIMALAFDNEVRELTDFSEDQKEIETAIRATESGFGKLLYEGVSHALERLKTVEGRRAVILFSDGVDMKSIEASLEGTTAMAEEVGAVIFVVHFETRWWIEADARRQEKEHPKSKTPFDIDGRIPLPPDFGGPDPTPTGIPKPSAPKIEIGERPRPPVVYDPDGTNTRSTRVTSAEPPDQITSTLDKLYGEADSFMQTITSRTGGRIYSADTFQNTKAAFAAIADELRNQYLIGYYASMDKRDGKYHKIKLEVSRKGLDVRFRPGYRAPSRTQ